MAADSCPKLADLEGVTIAIATGDTTMADGDAVRAALAHAESCAACAAELAAYRQLSQRLTPPRLPDDAAARIAERVGTTVRSRIVSWERRRRLIRWAGVAAALAAAVALVVGIAIVLPRGGEQAVPPDTAVQRPTPPPAATTPVPPPRKALSSDMRPEFYQPGSPQTASLRPKTKQAVPDRPGPAEPGLSREERKRVVLRVACAMSVVADPLRKGPSQEAIDEARRAIADARELIRAAPGTVEARRARYYAFRYLQLLGEQELSELEFQTYIEEVAAAEGVAAACKTLEQEGSREERARDYSLAFKRYHSMLSFGREGETAAVVYARIANVHAWKHQHDLAVAAFRKALALGAPTADARDCYQYLIRTGLSNRDYGQALHDGKALVALRTNEAQKANDEALLGMVLEKTDGPIKAAKVYRQILRKYPDKQCATARWRLRELEKKLEDAVLQPSR